MVFRKLPRNYYEGLERDGQSYFSREKKNQSRVLLSSSSLYCEEISLFFFFPHENSSGHLFLSKFVLA